MATPRISWDVFVPSSLQTGTKLTRWEEVNRSLSVFNSHSILCGEKSQRISLCGEASQVHFTLGSLYVHLNSNGVFMKVLMFEFFRFSGVQRESSTAFQCRQIWILFGLERRRQGCSNDCLFTCYSRFENSASRLAAEWWLCLARDTMFWKILTCVIEIFKILARYSGYLCFFS